MSSLTCISVHHYRLVIFDLIFSPAAIDRTGYGWLDPGYCPASSESHRKHTQKHILNATIIYSLGEIVHIQL